MPRQAPPPLRPSPGRGGGGGDRVWSPWWVTGGADPCAAEVAFGLPPGGLPCSVADGAGPRVVSQSFRPIAAAAVPGVGDADGRVMCGAHWGWPPPRTTGRVPADLGENHAVVS